MSSSSLPVKNLLCCTARDRGPWSHSSCTIHVSMLTTLLAVPKDVGKDMAGLPVLMGALLPGRLMMAAAPEDALPSELVSCRGGGPWGARSAGDSGTSLL